MVILFFVLEVPDHKSAMLICELGRRKGDNVENSVFEILMV